MGSEMCIRDSCEIGNFTSRKERESVKCPKIENADAKREKPLFVILNLQNCDIFVAAVVLLLKLPILSRTKNINFIFRN